MKLKEETLAKVLEAISITEEEEIDCDACNQEVDKYVELLKEGQDPTEVMPLVEQHLKVCDCCTEELKALLEALESIEKGED
jgi:hypothetical protein